MKRLWILSIGIFLLLLLNPLIVYSKSDLIPGQVKKTGNESNKKAVIGSVESISGKDVTVQKKDLKRINAEVDASTEIINQNKKQTKLGAVKLKNLIALISTDSSQFASDGAKIKKISKIYFKEASASAEMKRRAVSGVITDISGNVITLAHQIQRERLFQVLTDAQTVVVAKASESASLADLSIGQRIAAVGDLASGGGILARRIHIIPGKATGIFKRLPVATPSAGLKATPSASVVATPSAMATASALPSATPILSTSPTPAL